MMLVLIFSKLSLILLFDLNKMNTLCSYHVIILLVRYLKSVKVP